jgi:hypothetical protein
VGFAIGALADRASAQAVEPNDSSRVTPRPPPIIEGLFLMPVAPGALAFLLRKEPGPEFPPLGYWTGRVAAHIAGGPAFADSAGETWAYSAGVEALIRGIYAEVRNEHFRLPQHIEYRTARLGYLIHPLPEIAGGVTLGYRDARGVSGHRGMEIGFPFITGSRNFWLRYDAAYVMSRKMVSWSYRMQAEYVVRGGPLYIGLNVEAKTLPLRIGSKVSSVPVAVVVGVRH